MLQSMGLQRVGRYLVSKQLVSLYAAAGEDCPGTSDSVVGSRSQPVSASVSSSIKQDGDDDDDTTSS